jgi:5-formyltetrahydrofolate cyclo-ligase
MVGTAVFKSLKSFKPYQDSKRIGIYLSMPTGEIQTDSIVRHALEMGKQVFVPYIYKLENPHENTPKSVMEMLELHSLSDYVAMKSDSWGIPSITADTAEERQGILKGNGQHLDLILMPGMAFALDQESGCVRRLGHGRGYYDYFLHRYRVNRGPHDATPPGMIPGTDVLLYGLALKEQILDSQTTVPVGELDSLLHGLLVGDGEIFRPNP